MKTAQLVFPHHLYRDPPWAADEPAEVHLVEDSLFFGDRHHPVRFHKQKLWLHRATMRRYAEELQAHDTRVYYAGYPDAENPLRETFESIRRRKIRRVSVIDPTDFLLRKRIERYAARSDLRLHWIENPGFLNSPDQNREYRDGRKRWHMADFYQWQRRRWDILIEDDEPLGGKWSFDQENRKKVPKKRLDSVPQLPEHHSDDIEEQARDFVGRHFGDHPGSLDELIYPTSHRASADWLDRFLADRLGHFGDYEDAIEAGQSWLWHGVLTPMLNIGLLTPRQIVDQTLAFAESRRVPLNSLEGFIRQVIGWREFMRATYEDLGVSMRTTNHWGHHRAMPQSFYDGTTGIDPIDDVIRRILATGYCHHIERLMVLGGFMFLCEIEPNAIYRWFMEMFVDSYDWVMVPNVYAMSQHADGGAITTKPYFSGSAYIRKMSHYGRGNWSETWDGLYWRWIWDHRQQLRKNPRWAMMCGMAEKMDRATRESHLRNARSFLSDHP